MTTPPVRPSAAALLASLAAGVLLAAPLAQAHGASPAETAVEAVYYVHGFDDPSTFEYPTLSELPPTGETPNEESCTDACAGEAKVTYNFTLPAALTKELAIDDDADGNFTFYIKGIEPADGAVLPPGNIRVSFNLTIEPGNERIGQGSWQGIVTAQTPTLAAANFDVNVQKIPIGKKLRWQVDITSIPANVYTPNVAPYGVSSDAPFKFSFTKVVPNANAALEFHSEAAGLTVDEGAPAVFNFTLENHGSRPSSVVIRVTSSHSVGTINLTSNGNPAAAAREISPGEDAAIALTLSANRLPIGTHNITLEANGTRGELAEGVFRITVQEPAPEDEGDEGGLPGFEGAAVLAAGTFAVAWARRRRVG